MCGVDAPVINQNKRHRFATRLLRAPRSLSSGRHHLLIIEAVPARSRRLETCIETGADAFRAEPWTYAPAPRPIESTGLGCSMRGFHASVRQTGGRGMATPGRLRVSIRFLEETATFRTTSLGMRRTSALRVRTSHRYLRFTKTIAGNALQFRVQTSPGTQVMGTGGGGGSSGNCQATGISNTPAAGSPASLMAGEKRALRITAVQAAASRSPWPLLSMIAQLCATPPSST